MFSIYYKKFVSYNLAKLSYKFLIVIAALILYSSVSLAKGIVFDLPLIINKSNVGDISAEIIQENLESKANVYIPIDRFTELVTNFASDKQLNVWLQTASDKKIGIAELQKQGLDIFFDANNIILNAVIPYDGIKKIKIKSSKDKYLSYQKPSFFSSGLNIRYKTAYNHKLKEDNQTSSIFNFQSVTNVGGFSGWNFYHEGSFNVLSSEYKKIKSLLVHDDYDNAVRFSFGDINPEASRFQSINQMFGFNMQRRYSDIQPFKNLTSSGYKTFSLQRESVVKFIVNGVIVDEKNLMQGTYSVSDFPVTYGLNDVIVIVDDGFGEIEEYVFSVYSDMQLLSPNVTNFGLTLGVMPEEQFYEADKVILGYFEKGINNSLTSGGYFEYADGHSLYTLNVIKGVSLGLIHLSGAYSKNKNYGEGSSYLFQYNAANLEMGNLNIKPVFQYSENDNNFYSYGQTEPIGWNKRINFNTSFNLFNTSLSLSMQNNKSNKLDRKSYSLGINKRLAGINFSTNLQKSISRYGENSESIVFSMSKSFDNIYTISQFNPDKNSFSFNAGTPTAIDVGEYGSSIELSRDDEKNELELNFDSTFSRLSLRGNHNQKYNKADKRTDAQTTVNLNTAIGFSGKNFGFGKPFNESFIVLDKHSNLRGKIVNINKGFSSGQLYAKGRHLDNLLLDIGTGYRPMSYFIQVDDLPFGYDLGDNRISVFSGNRSGYHYKLGSDAVNTLIGTIIGPNGEPVSLRSGYILNKNTDERLVVFTNKTGRFVVEKMDLGEFLLVIEGKIRLGADLTLDNSDNQGLIRAGKIQVKELNNE